MPPIEIRPFDPACDDYGALAALWTAQYPDLPRNAEIWRRRDLEPTTEDAAKGRLIALRSSELLGMAEFEGCPVAGEPGQLQVGFASRDGADRCAVLDALGAAIHAAIEPLDPPLLVAYARDTQPDMVAFYQRLGFETVQRTASSEFRSAGFDPAPAAAARSCLQDLGYDLYSARELAAEDPEWRRSYFALEQAVLADVPFLGPRRVEPYERFLERLGDPTQFDPDATFVARHTRAAELAGLSLLHTYAEIPGYAFAALTGTLRAHRRRGIARTLKLATLDYARSNGIERIVTLNEENNPMLSLNHALGFKTQHVQLTLSKRLHAGEPG